MTKDKDTRHIAPDPLALAVEMKARREPFAIATVIETRGSTSARLSAKAIFDREGGVVSGWVGGGCAESTVAHAAIESIESGEPQTIDIDLDDEVLGAGMPCGGAMRVYVEPVLPQPVLWVLGHGRVAETLSRLGAMMGFEIVVDDPMAEATRFPDAARILTDDPGYAALTPAATDFVVVATQHKGDHQSMQQVLKSKVRYVALIASRKRTGLVLDYLRAEGFDSEALACVRAPAGLDLNARTPEEIALSVISEIVMERRGGSGMAASHAPAAPPPTVPAMKVVRS
jgi:xanthine dehydrogenase accessory factor